MRSVLVAVAALVVCGSAAAQEAPWRTVAPENLLIIDTAKGRVLVELEPRAAPQHVERIRTLADQGFYDGLKFHRVIAGFMAQTGDPLGTGEGASPLPDVPGEFAFRRGRDPGFVMAAGGRAGWMGSLPVSTQPDAQMMVTADFKVPAGGLFCPGVAGMARSSSPDSANSQFFLMTGRNERLDGQYTAFGRVLQGMDVVRALNAGPSAADGKVDNPDLMTRARTAAALRQAERPVVQVRLPTTAATATDVCAVEPEVQVRGGSQ
jgi:cyclophilin family peptidyl-prolyl cis-trans isomerase